MSVVFPRELEPTYGNGFLIELTERENMGMGMGMSDGREGGAGYPLADVGPRVGSRT